MKQNEHLQHTGDTWDW